MKEDVHQASRPPVPETTTENHTTPTQLKKLGLPGHEARVGPRLAMAPEQERKADRRPAMHHWTDEEVSRYIEAFKTRRPGEYARYLKQEAERKTIETHRLLQMLRFAASVFPHVSLIELTQLLGRVRNLTRGSLRLNWDNKDG